MLIRVVIIFRDSKRSFDLSADLNTVTKVTSSIERIAWVAMSINVHQRHTRAVFTFVLIAVTTRESFDATSQG